MNESRNAHNDNDEDGLLELAGLRLGVFEMFGGVGLFLRLGFLPH